VQAIRPIRTRLLELRGDTRAVDAVLAAGAEAAAALAAETMKDVRAAAGYA
jgi:hypothetical protein